LFSLPTMFHRIFKRGRRPALPLLSVFQHFRTILRNNNRALEIIADMGEKLGGGFIFDRHYITTSVDALLAAVRDSILALGAIDPCHKKLLTLLQTMAREIQDIMDCTDDRNGPLLLALDRIDSSHWPVVGGKSAHLAEISRRLDLRVPSGFVVTTRCYHDLIDHNGLRPLVDHFESLWSTADNSAAAALDHLRRSLRQAIARAMPPPGLLDALADQLPKGGGQPAHGLAVRSSAREEDQDFTFAGQYLSLLHVAPRPQAIFSAYRQVAASLFNAGAVQYRRRFFPDRGRMSIAVLCQEMVDAAASGVVYSSDPADPDADDILIVGGCGLGADIVEGEATGDTFRVSRTTPPAITGRSLASKKNALVSGAESGLATHPLPETMQEQSCLDDDHILELAAAARTLELFFKRPQDIEWSFDRKKRLCILQSRPVVVSTTGTQTVPPLSSLLQRYECIVQDRGEVAQQGTGAGPVFLCRSLEDLERFPDGAVLVAPKDSSRFIRVMHRAAAIVTASGTPVSHMATLCREMRLPCLVNVPEIMSRVTDGMEITVDALERRIFKGIVREILTFQNICAKSEVVPEEFHLLQRLLNIVSRLNLVDPLLDRFTPEKCRTLHDLLRYIHETAVAALVEIGRNEKKLFRQHLVRPLDLPVPAGIMTIDIGGGLKENTAAIADFQAVTSIPFRAILQGMLFPGVWHRKAMPVGFRDMMHSMLNAPADALSGQYTGHNIAVIGATYVNLCFRFGYHFNIIDAHCDTVARENHIYFRFLGGATDLTKRSRRSRLIAEILTAFDFNVRTRGDLVIARAGNMPPHEVERSLDILGRLVGFTRQLDVLLDSDAMVERYVEAFLQGNYEILQEQ